MADKKQIKKTVADYFSAIRNGDLDAWLSTFAEGAISHDPVGAPPHRGREGLRQFFENIGSAFETIALHEENLFIAGNEAAVKWHGEGTGHNGKEVTFEGIDVFEIDDEGKITEVRAYWNPRAVLEDLEN
ncbi:MAG: nuclear transport factor 2 family protein [Balneolaceae bacterium]|nr:nuclear transport factor 2 family protein [Balneolaceae bacterium]